jgi:GNAT superfamily N-acetyltransferase
MLTHRVATAGDVPQLRAVMEAAIGELQRGFLDADQIAASYQIMGVDTRLVADGTYVVVECNGEIAGCGGWSRRATMYGGDHSHGRDDALLDPAVDAARIRAMYTDPRFARRGVGTRILRVCEAAAVQEGFRRLELVATLSGRPLYEAFGFVVDEAIVDTSAGVEIPLMRMSKRIPVPQVTFGARPQT